MTMDYNNASDSGVLLKINDVQLEDEATYKCEITYLEVKEQCEVIQIVKLKILVAPKDVTIKTSDGDTLTNASVLGPKEEEDEVTLTCEAKEGKPIPRVSWYNGTMKLAKAEYISVDPDGDGIGTGLSVLRLRISRWDLNARFECRVESEALEQPIVSWITTEVHVKPTKIELTGVKNHVVQGTNVLLICDVFGARPPATIRWVNGSTPITNQSMVQTSPEDNTHLKTSVREEVRIQSSTIEDRDGTFTTKSQLVFQATHWENGQTIHCYAENNVTKNHNESEFHDLLVMEVRFPPVITVPEQYKNITINESTPSQLLDCKYIANPQKLEEVMWSKDDRNLTLTDKTKYEGGDTTNLQLIIHNITRDDMGEYKCWLKNEVGIEHSEDALFINVQYAPDVEVIMEPSTPVKAVDKKTVNLECNVTSGNPSTLSKVQWYLNGVIMKELPECNYTTFDEDGNGVGDGGPLCSLDPSILGLEKVDKSFAGNYSCRGMNLAGWGPMSEAQELVVHFPPSPAIVKYYPSQVIKGGVVTLECTVKNPGNPSNITYIWMRGSHQMSETVSNYTLPVRLETRNNYTCIAQNEGGQSNPGSVFINVSAPPAFINKLPTYQGILYTAEHINLTCRVECSPLCAIVWKKNGVILNTNTNPMYYVKTNTYPPDKSKNDFESIESTLIWNMTARPGHKLDKTATNSSTYTCQSMSNSIGKGVDSTIEIAVDYPPEDVAVTPQIVDVAEGRVPAAVRCRGKGHPALTYQWRRAGGADDDPPPQVPANPNGDELRLGAVRRADSGAYVCEARNKHGTEEAKVYVNVLYAPECTLKKTQKDGSAALLCTAVANPQDVTFTWKVREQNDTFFESFNVVQDGLNSYLFLDSSIETYRTYYCYANNSVAMSAPCEVDVQGNLPWYQRIHRDKLIVILASIVAIVICVIIICIVIIVLCRRKRTDAKYNSSLEMEEREKPDGHSPGSEDQAKWPLKPVVTFKKFKPTSPTCIEPEKVNPRKRKKPGLAPNQFSIGDRMNSSSAPASGGAPAGAPGADPHPDDKGFYENLPFHGIQNPPNKPISIIAPFNQASVPSFSSAKSLLPLNQSSNAAFGLQQSNPKMNAIKRNQSFHGFQNTFDQPPHPLFPHLPMFYFSKNFSNPYLTQGCQRRQNLQFSTNFIPMIFSQLPTNLNELNGNNTISGLSIPNFQNRSFGTTKPNNQNNPFNVTNKNVNRVVGRNEKPLTIRRSASGINASSTEQIRNELEMKRKSKKAILSDKQFGSLEIKKHKCYSPIFYSMRCKKHAKKRPVIYALPKKCLKQTSKSTETTADVEKTATNDGFKNLTDSIQISEQDLKSPEKSYPRSLPTPAPRCRRHREIIYANISNVLTKNQCPVEADRSHNSSTESAESVRGVSVIEAQVHISSTPQSDNKARVDDSQSNKENELPKTNTSQNPSKSIFPATSPKPKNIHLINLSPTGMKNSPTLKVSPNFVKPKTQSPKGALSIQIQAKLKASPTQSPSDNPATSLLTEREEEVPDSVKVVPQMPIINTQAKRSPGRPAAVAASKEQNAFYTLTTPHYKQAAAPPQYSATIPHQKHTKIIPRALFQEQLPKSKSFTSKSKKNKHFQIPLQKCNSFKFQTAESYFQPIKNIHEQNLMRNGYASDGGRAKQKTKGPLVLAPRQGEYREQFPEDVQSSVRLQYPQPIVGGQPMPNGVVYADLDMPKGRKQGACAAVQSPGQGSVKPKQPQKKPKTEYATLQFNDVGQEIDV